MLFSRFSEPWLLLALPLAAACSDGWGGDCASGDCLDGCLHPKFAEYVRDGASSRQAYHADIREGAAHERFVGRLYRNLPYVLITCSSTDNLHVRVLAGEDPVAIADASGPDPTLTFSLDAAAPVRVKLWGDDATSVDFRLLSLEPD